MSPPERSDQPVQLKRGAQPVAGCISDGGPRGAVAGGLATSDDLGVTTGVGGVAHGSISGAATRDGGMGLVRRAHENPNACRNVGEGRLQTGSEISQPGNGAVCAAKFVVDEVRFRVIDGTRRR